MNIYIYIFIFKPIINVVGFCVRQINYDDINSKSEFEKMKIIRILNVVFIVD